MGFRKKAKTSTSSTPMYPNPPQFGTPSGMPYNLATKKRSGSDMPNDSEQREEFKARKTKEFPGARKEKTYGSLPGGSTLDRPAKDYQ